MIRIDGALVAEWAGEALEVQQAFEAAVLDLAAGVYIAKCIHSGNAYHLRMVKR
ncbi:MAG: hypothetical protein IPP17_30240 [Bacteroidetes bacterium]|nr:hypothetical protein [Bacteroidota bacterium]